jgi:phosphocarrier protein HPr
VHCGTILRANAIIAVRYFGGIMLMETKKIKLLAPEDVKDFVKAAEKCNFDIDIYYNRVIIDAKSFLGIMSMDLSNALNVKYGGYNDDFEGVIKKYAL